MRNNNKEKDDKYNPNNKICNHPTYRIYGKERRKYKKKLSELKYFVSYFWRDHNEEKDMMSIYGGKVMDDQRAKELYDSKVKRKEELEKLLSQPYLPVFREERLSKLLDN
ncbi:MAG: hypothetical protein SLAVMIC_00050 [uncultured marine phage]|uniref:Uncharacterized protein n=1 Tax=uncultured marine phage TaxID=707152 RepID=A0A8D9C889_9VIRU|nr:MAG: hypothetical protein SLAVMIC_00050 [uncultured marine phage]